MVIRIDHRTATRKIRRNGDATLLDREPPRLGVLAVGGERGIAHELIEAAVGPQGCPRRSHRFIVRHCCPPISRRLQSKEQSGVTTLSRDLAAYGQFYCACSGSFVGPFAPFAATHWFHQEPEGLLP